MKFIIRAFALALVATGAAASAHITRNDAPQIVGKASAVPVPTCPPSDPNGCGIGNMSGN